jgi:hypothetical protein
MTTHFTKTISEHYQPAMGKYTRTELELWGMDIPYV